MKKSRIFLSFLFLGLLLGACEEQEKVTLTSDDVVASALNNLSGTSFVLQMDNADETFQTFTWTATDFGFPAATTYHLQVDVAGNNFASAAEVASVTNKLTASITEGDFNKILLNMSLNAGEAADLEFRVSATINENVDPVYSNVVSAEVTPYATVFPPIYMCGAATGGWDWTKGVEMRSSAPNVYNTIAYFLNGEAFRFFAQPDWNPTSYNYPYFDGGSVTPLLENAQDGDLNFRVVGATGYYSITVDLNAKTVAMESVPEPKMFMTGAALGGWDWSTNYVQMTWVSNGIFTATTEFINGEAFRFFAQQDWNPTSYNYPYFADGTVSALFENALDGDSNFRFIGATGDYKITLNMLDLIVEMEAVTP